MSKYIYICIAMILCTSFTNDRSKHYEECDVVAFYRAKTVPYTTKALDSYGELVEIKTLLTPDKEIKSGRYKVTINKEADNLYQIVGTNLYMETSLCLELAIYDDVILKVIDYQGCKFGTITFVE